MIRIRRADARGRFQNDWLDARFSFSFGDYQDPAYDGYSDLMVMNDDRVAPGGGFTPHSHRDVEVMSYPLAGAVEHRDSLGNVAVMRPGDVHLMRAGTGIRHSEMNASAAEPEHHLQWWITPSRSGLPPAYARIHVSAEEKRNTLRLIGSPDGADNSLALAQNIRVFASIIDGARVTYTIPPGRRTYLHVVRESLLINGERADAGDDVFVERESQLLLEAPPGATTELLLFDLR